MKTDWYYWRKIVSLPSGSTARAWLEAALEAENENNRLVAAWKWAADCLVDAEHVRVQKYRMGGNGTSTAYFVYAKSEPFTAHITELVNVERGRVVLWHGRHKTAGNVEVLPR